jgi:hypothetical protein
MTDKETGTTVKVNQDVKPFLLTAKFTSIGNETEDFGGSAMGLGYTILWWPESDPHPRGCRPEDLLVAIVARLSSLQDLPSHASEGKQEAIDLIGRAYHILMEERSERATKQEGNKP